MARETRVVALCDRCKKDADVLDLTVVYGYGTNQPWEVDLCRSCYDSILGGLMAVSRAPEIKNIRPQTRFKKTEITADML